MLSTVFRFRTVTCRSFHATSCRLSAALTRARISKVLAILSKETKNPMWNLINAPYSSRLSPLGFTPPRHEKGRQIDDCARWASVTSQVDIDSALQTLRTLPSKHVPSWLAFYLVIYKVRSSAHAEGPMMDFAFAQLNSLPVELQGYLLIFTAIHLAKFNLLQPLKRVVDTFLNISLSHGSLQFNILLQALSVNSIRSVESANLVVQVLKAMEGRQLKLRPETYHALLNDRFITVQLTKFLLSRMTHEGIVPDVSHLEAYLRIFAKGGAIHEMQSYVDAIRGLNPPEGRSPTNSAASGSHSSTVTLSGFKDRASAFEFLQSLTEAKDGATRPVSLPPSPYLLRLNKKKLDTHDYTASLTVAARDPSINTRQLMRMFRQIGSMRGSSVRPTIVSYTTIIRGLLYRDAVPPAGRLWNEIIRAGYVLDRPALTVGVETLTRARRPHEAFELLEKHAQKGFTNGFARQPSTHHRVDIHVLSSFMDALNKTKRPDVVFMLWGHMGELYNVHPTSETLSILLQAAKLACQLDNTFHGTVAHLALRNPFRKPNPLPATRDEILQSITSILGDSKRGPVEYSSGIWNDELPFHGARRVFLQVIFGNAYYELIKAEPPAQALRKSIDTDTPMGLPAPFPPQHQLADLKLPPDLLNSKGRSWYPHIIPSNRNFQQYLLLLGLNQHAAEIPITLAWMRASRIRPDRATLAIALVFWAEVSVHAPLIESWMGGEGKNQFTRLVEWMKDWVGEEKMPKPENVSRWLHLVKRMREGDE
ncbi:hypothetical protein AX15_005119 [Amanita polypyramis BW_CC]|nr:hypothetical protein AX15_005119 [Amanita polypyramis BW_CC]